MDKPSQPGSPHPLLCTATGMSKSGLYAHFGSKQELQLATVEEADRILVEEVVRPAAGMAPTVIFREVGIRP